MTLLVTILTLGVAAWLVAFLQPRGLLDFVAARSKGVLYYVNTNQKVVALTIDDGPHPDVTSEILAVLKKHGARATFFLIGERIPPNGELLARMRAEGHELANHLMTDIPSILLSAAAFREHMRRTHALIEEHEQPRWLRPGWGWFNKRMLDDMGEAGYRCCLGSVHPRDPLLRSASLIAAYVLWKVFPGSIIILHDGKRNRIRTVKVLDRVLPELKRRGYRIATVHELVEGVVSENSIALQRLR